MTEPTPRPWKSCRPSHTTYQGWTVTIHDGTIPACRALGVTRSHALANASLIVKAVNIQERIERILSTRPEDHDEQRRINWLRDRLAMEEAPLFISPDR
jgi:hypothetical protein